MRGLDAADGSEFARRRNRLEVAQEIHLPRTTVYRFLEPCAMPGSCFAMRRTTLRLTIMVRGLSDGFDDEAWVTQIAKPLSMN